MAISVLFLTRYDRLGASSRLRSLQFFPSLAGHGILVKSQPFFDDKLLGIKYKTGRYSLSQLLHAYYLRVAQLLKKSQFDLIWIEKEALPWTPTFFEILLLGGSPFVLDYDDALFHNYDLHRLGIVRTMLGDRLDKLMKKSVMVTCGNTYLASRAVAAGAPSVEIVPTVIDLDRYPNHKPSSTISRYGSKLETEPLRIVWIGSPTTSQYLQLLGDALRKLAVEHKFVLRIIGGGSVSISGVEVEEIDWSEDTEVENILNCDIGIMPLIDSPWERGKCGYKLIQYMACGLPVVASGVGVNSEIVRGGENGFLAATTEEWVDALSKLLQSSDLRFRMGTKGRQRVEQEYCLQKIGPHVARLLRTAAGKH